MRWCQCILGKDGKCCQDTTQGPSWWGPVPAAPLPSSPHPLWNTSWSFQASQRRRVRKWAGRWMVSNHPGGPRTFMDWGEAMRYASTPYRMMNV